MSSDSLTKLTGASTAQPLDAEAEAEADRPPPPYEDGNLLVIIMKAVFFLQQDYINSYTPPSASASLTAAIPAALFTAEAIEAVLTAVHIPSSYLAFIVPRIMAECQQLAVGQSGTVQIEAVIEIFVDRFPPAFHHADAYADAYEVIGFVPASEESIDDLERVRVSEESSSSDLVCPVCLEEIPGGSEAIRLPCSHHFHGDCIVKWLSNSKFCPLCRFEMPS